MGKIQEPQNRRETLRDSVFQEVTTLAITNVLDQIEKRLQHLESYLTRVRENKDEKNLPD